MLRSENRPAYALSSTPLRGVVAIGLFVALANSHAASAPDSATQDLLALPIEQLLQMKVTAASRYAQNVSDVAAAPQVITADEIRGYGYRTLIEILDHFGGTHTQFDGLYARVGSRGFLRPGDYNSRILLLIDGYRVNEPIYDGAYLGNEGPIDVSLIERVEFVPGPGSSVYGGNALFGVVNVVTQQPRKTGVALRAAAGSPSAVDGAARATLKLDNGAAGMLAISRQVVRGEYRDVSAITGQPDSRSADRQRDDVTRVFAKFTAGPVAVSAGSSDRITNVVNGIYFTDPQNAGQTARDKTQFLDVSAYSALSKDVDASGRIALSGYDFRGTYVNRTDEGELRTIETATSRSISAEGKLVARVGTGHTIVAGAEAFRAHSLRFRVVEEGSDADLVNVDAALTRVGVFAQDDYRINDALLVSGGARWDKDSGRDGVFSPRAGVVFRPDAKSVLKAQYGRAFRSPNAYERFYDVPAYGYVTDPNVREERVTTSELIAERAWTDNATTRLTLFRNRISNLIDLIPLESDSERLRFQNVPGATVRGAQLDASLADVSGWRATASVTTQSGTDEASGESLRFSPKRLAKLHVLSPRFAGVRTGLEWLYTGPQLSRDATMGGYGLTNLTFSTSDLSLAGARIAFSVRNVFNKRFAYPLSDESLVATEPGEGRRLWLQLDFAF